MPRAPTVKTITINMDRITRTVAFNKSVLNSLKGKSVAEIVAKRGVPIYVYNALSKETEKEVREENPLIGDSELETLKLEKFFSVGITTLTTLENRVIQDAAENKGMSVSDIQKYFESRLRSKGRDMNSIEINNLKSEIFNEWQKSSQIEAQNAVTAIPNPYALYFKDHYNELKTKNPHAKVTDIMKLVGDKWKTLSITQKNVYTDRVKAIRRELGLPDAPIKTVRVTVIKEKPVKVDKVKIIKTADVSVKKVKKTPKVEDEEPVEKEKVPKVKRTKKVTE